MIGVSGREERIASFLKQYLSGKGIDADVDARGNVFVFLRGRRHDRRVLITAHMDETGYIVSEIRPDGLLRVKNVGAEAAGGLSRVVSEKGAEGITDISARGFKTVDVGAETEEEARGMADIGDAFVNYGGFTAQGGRIIGRALDNRAAVAALAEAATLDPAYDTVFGFTVREEISGAGAAYLAEKFRPDFLLCLDAAAAKCRLTETNDTNLITGRGVGIKYADACTIVDGKYAEMLEKLARNTGIPYQKEVCESGTTELFAVERVCPECAFGALSLPVSNMHTAHSAAAVADCDALAALIKQFLENGAEL